MLRSGTPHITVKTVNTVCLQITVFCLISILHSVPTFVESGLYLVVVPVKGKGNSSSRKLCTVSVDCLEWHIVKFKMLMTHDIFI